MRPALLILVLLPFMTPAAAALTSNPAAKILCDFEAEPEAQGISATNGATLERTTENATAGNALKITYPDAGEYPGFNLQPRQPDWSGHDLFAMDVFNPTDSNLYLSFDCSDARASGWGQRFGDSVWAPSGRSTIAFPIRPMLSFNELTRPDMKNIRRVACWITNRPKGLTLTIDNLRLTSREALAEKPLSLLALPDLRWTNVEGDAAASATSPPVQGSKDSPVKAEPTPDGLKLTFSGGRFPTVATPAPAQVDLGIYRALEAEITVPRTCVVLFRLVYDHKPGTKRADLPRWEKAARCQPGRNLVIEDIAGDAKRAKPVAVEIAMYNPREGETITIHQVRFLRTPPSAATAYRGRNVVRPGQLRKLFPDMEVRWRALGEKEDFADPIELADRFKNAWKKPDPQKNPRTVKSVEAEMSARLDEFRKTNPKATLVTFRKGQKGYDPASPEKPFAGWADTYVGGHDPATTFLGQVAPHGNNEKYEVFLRRRAALIRIDISSIPKDSEILAAQLLMVRASEPKITPKPDAWSPYKPTFFVAEACNRPWVESEENVLEYAKDKFWQEISGMSWNGPDPDFLPLILAFGQGDIPACSWDFTQAVRYWHSGNPNHGFALYSLLYDYMDYMTAWSGEAKDPANRPALLVIYAPPASPLR